MSQIVDYEWKLRQEARRREYLARVADTSSRFLTRYRSILTDLSQQGLDKYIPSEFSRAKRKLAEAEASISTDPERSRELSLELGSEVSGLPALARASMREVVARERQREEELATMRKQAGTELSQALQAVMTEILDPIERDFAFDSLRQLQREHSPQAVEPDDLPRLKEQLRVRVAQIKEDAASKSRDWKIRKARESACESATTLIEIHRQEAASDIDRSPTVIDGVLASLDHLREQIAKPDWNIDELKAELSNVSATTDSAIVDENCRRTTVRSVMEALEKSGFVTDSPQRNIGASDEVVIFARKPAGNEATFRITVDGSLTYKFDHYEGSKCKSDIDNVLPLLQEIYGIQLSNERVIWENPDRISQSSRPIDGQISGQKHGK